MTHPVKIVFCLTRKEGMSRAEFQRYWLDVHAGKVAGVADDIGMVRYVQNHSLDSPMNDALAGARGGLPGYDGVMEGWFESEEAALAVMGSDAGQAAGAMLLDDEARFIDFDRSPIFLVHEKTIY